MFQKDYVLRQIQQVAEAVAQAIGLVARGQLDEADAELDDTLDGLLPIDRGLFESLSAHSVLPLLGPPETAAAVGKVLCAQADLREARGDTADAARLRRRAEVFLEHARGQGVDCDGQLAEPRDEQEVPGG